MPSWLSPENMYLGSQYYGQKFGSIFGGLIGGDTGEYWGGKAGRFAGDVFGAIGGGLAAVVEGVGYAIGYGIATENPLALADEAYILGSGLIHVGTNILDNTAYAGKKAVASAVMGRNLFNDNDINRIVDTAADITSFIVPVKVGKNVKIKDVSISKIDNLGANPKYSKINAPC